MKDDPKQSVWKIRVFDGSEIEPEDNYYVTLSDEQNTSESPDGESKSDQSNARSARATERR